MSAPVNRSNEQDGYAGDDDDNVGNGGNRDHDDRDMDSYDDAEFVISSDDACVAATTITCQRCRRPFEAICIYCRIGTCFGEPLEDFTIANINRMDTTLADSLSAWPHFHPLGSPEEPGEFANHCPSCGAPHEDHVLHDEPEDPFFDIAHAAPGRLRLTPLPGQIQLSGDEHYQVE
ncbi:MAG TPA: hypothetical protein VHY19_09820 [Steroidobacteraceae bacterium]|jgi:hypothetical protein|nr:hypothetical protein [Steroidobacteraceae bacterium]